MKRISLLLLSFSLGIFTMAQSQEIILWPSGAPGALGTAPEDIPSITVYKAKSNPTHAAVLVCPGGGYITLAMDHEGKQIAEWFNSLGVTAFILKYRVNNYENKKYGYPAAFNDASRAIRTIKYRSSEWGIDTSKLGIMGFSAGGHLTSTMGTHFDMGNPLATDPIEKLSSRPTFMILCYPVITFKEATGAHLFSRQMLLGKDPDPKLVEFLSNETQVKPNTPPTFIFQTNEDETVPAENAVSFYLALRKLKIPVEMHIFEPGKHGVGLAKNDPVLSVWPSLLQTWLAGKGILAK